MKSLPIIAIVGRPNVGKSTLFNRILGEQRAIVEDLPGVTRDRNYARVEKYSVPFFIVDTGGYSGAPQNDLERDTIEQALAAIEEADHIIAVFDGNLGLQPADVEVCELLRKSNRSVTWVVNKCDGVEQAVKAAEFWALGVSELHDISALHGRNVRPLIEEILRSLPNYAIYRAGVEESALIAAQQKELAERELREFVKIEEETFEPEGLEEIEEDEREFAPVLLPGEDVDQYLSENRLTARPEVREFIGSGAYKKDEEEAELNLDEVVESGEILSEIRVAIVGRPNVGKSTLINTLCGEYRAIASSVSGTTRDSLDVELERTNQAGTKERYVLVDTAGLRKESRISSEIERFSTLRSMRAISGCDVAVVLFDATEGPTDQDVKVVGLVHEEGKGLVIAVNKWEAIEKNHKSVREMTEKIREFTKFAPYAEIIFISAQSGRRCEKILGAARHAALERRKRISTGVLNATVRQALRKFAAPTYRGLPLKLHFVTQIDIAPPTFVMFVNHRKAVHFSFVRFVKNVIREKFKFGGSDLKFLIREREADEAMAVNS